MVVYVSYFIEINLNVLINILNLIISSPYGFSTTLLPPDYTDLTAKAQIGVNAIQSTYSEYKNYFKYFPND